MYSNVGVVVVVGSIHWPARINVCSMKRRRRRSSVGTWELNLSNSPRKDLSEFLYLLHLELGHHQLLVGMGLFGLWILYFGQWLGECGGGQGGGRRFWHGC